MAEPITIGGQRFIKTADGWVDQKSKTRAPEGLLKLLNSLQVENSSEGKKKRVRIDTSRPVVRLGKTEYVWDLNSGVWIDKKTKDAVNPAFSKLIEAAYQGIIQGVTPEEQSYDKSKAASSVVNNMGSTGQAAKQKVRTSTGGGRLPAPNIKINSPSIKINSPIVQMIEKLATVDGYLKQRLDNQKKIANRNLVATKEAAIESKSGDASPVEQVSENDAEKSDATGIGVALLVGGLIAAQFEPVQEAFKSLASGIKSVFNFVRDVASVVSDGLDFFTGSSSASDSKVETSTAAPNITQGNTPSSPKTAPQAKLSVPSEANEAVPSAITPSSVAPTTPAITPNFSSTQPTMAPSSNSSSSRVNASSAAPNNSGSRAAAPSPTRSNATPAPMVSSSNAAPSKVSAPTPTPNATPASAAPTTPNATPSSAAPATPNATPSSAATPNATPDGSNYDGLRLKSQEAISGGQAASKTIEFAKIVQAQIPELTRFTAFSDSYHKGRTSKHNEGLAFDFTIKDPSQSTAVADRVKAAADANGYKVKILDEYKNASAGATGGHIHVTVVGPGTGSTIEGGGGSSILEQVTTVGANIGKGAIEAIGNILRAGLGEMTPTSGSQLSTVNDTMSGNIARAAKERTATVAATKTPKPVAVTKSDPVNMNAPSGSSTIQNMPTASDKAGVEFYLTRMGFPKITYEQTSR
jgi:hypothetical protein